MESSPEPWPDCFEYDLGIAVVHGAFISVHERLFHGSHEFSLQGLTQDQLEILGEVVQNSVNLITQRIEDKLYRKVEHCRKSSCHKRIHGAILYNVLRSQGICCSEASEYFATVEGAFPKLDWRSYFFLQKSLKWNLIFFDQMVQVPPRILMVILHQALLEISDDENICLSALSSILQVVLHQLLSVKRTSRDEKKEVVNFGFPFQITSEIDGSQKTIEVPETDSKASTITSEDIIVLLNALEKLKISLKLVKIVLLGLNTLLQKIISCRHCHEYQMVTDAVRLYLDFSRKILDTEEAKSCLRTGFGTFRVDCDVLASSVDVHVVYIVIFIYSKLDSILSGVCEDDDATGDKDTSWLHNLHEDLNALYVCLPEFPSAPDQETDIDFEEYIKCLIHVVSSKEICRHYAYKLLVKSPELLMRQDVIDCIEKNWQRCITSSSVFLIMMESILKLQGPKRNSLIEVFVAIFNCSTVPIRKEVVREFISLYGLSEVFKLPYFEAEFRSSNRNVTQEQAVKLILSLCLQSPTKALEMIVEKMLTSGQTKCMLMALKEVNFVCKYRDKVDSVPLLIRVLKPVLKPETSDKKKADNILAFIQDLLEVFYGDESFPVNEFIESCILCNLHGDADIDFHLSLLNVVLAFSLERDDVEWVSKLPISPLVVLLCNVISSCIVSYRSFTKASAISALNSFLQLHRKVSFPGQLNIAGDSLKWIRCHLQSMHPAVKFYVQDLIGLAESDIETMDLHDLLCLYAVIKNTDVSVLERYLDANYPSFSSTAIILALVQVLPHATVGEMLQLVDALSYLGPKYLPSPSSNLQVPESEKIVLAVVDMLIDAFFLLQHCKSVSLNWTCIISSFSQVIKDLCVRDFAIPTYTKLFMELCRLIEKTKDHHEQYSVTLQRVLEKFKNEKTLYRYLSCIMYSF